MPIRSARCGYTRRHRVDVAIPAVEDNLYRCSHVGSPSEALKTAREKRPVDVRPFSRVALAGMPLG